MMSTPPAAPKKRGPKPKPEGTRAIDSRVNVSMDVTAQEAIASLQTKLAARMGFTPTVTQTLMWVLSRADRLLEQDGEIRPVQPIGR